MGIISRIYGCFHPPAPPKSTDAIRFGVLGAADIAPLALFKPAKSHPEVIVQAISARNRKKAEEYAKTHGVLEVKDTYQGRLKVTGTTLRSATRKFSMPMTRKSDPTQAVLSSSFPILTVPCGYQAVDT
ncbi:hypothetical protein A0O28_0016490 [Trichoderma guizhouense]|uniref:Gfo/Idh/MocA-like oxidoreductase N-terminal domain-containing protein n=1 Tax=Trichoderma guizhouense TaxID=1491466 RepID=A0A1T3CBP7_9HYPO|nr:hypothetical protein A0O28_0016490 [Trichoderma guizhouense]